MDNEKGDVFINSLPIEPASAAKIWSLDTYTVYPLIEGIFIKRYSNDTRGYSERFNEFKLTEKDVAEDGRVLANVTFIFSLSDEAVPLLPLKFARTLPQVVDDGPNAVTCLISPFENMIWSPIRGDIFVGVIDDVETDVPDVALE